MSLLMASDSLTHFTTACYVFNLLPITLKQGYEPGLPGNGYDRRPVDTYREGGKTIPEKVVLMLYPDRFKLLKHRNNR